MSSSRAESASSGPARERRSTVRLYKCWDEARRNKPLPAISDFDFSVIEDLRSQVFLLGLDGPDRTPIIRYIGSGLTQEIGRDLTRLPLSKVPRPSLLAHIAYQYLRAIARRQPLAIEGTFVASPFQTLFHRGVLLPFSETGEAVDAVLGSFRYRTAAGQASHPVLVSKTTSEPAPKPAKQPLLVRVEPPKTPQPMEGDLRAALRRSRALAEEALAGEAGSRRQLYRALAGCYAFILAADADPAAYRDLLRKAQIRPQPRAPFTPAVKLVFGGRVTKTQLSEYAALLSHVKRLALSVNAVEPLLEKRGLKTCLREERQARRQERGSAPQLQEDLGQATSQAPILGEGKLREPCARPVMLLLARRSGGDPAHFEVIAVEEDEARLDGAQRRLAQGRARRVKSDSAEQAA